MWKRILIGLLIVIIAGGALAWLNRQAIIMAMLKRAAQVEVAENRPIEWTQGPATASADRSEGPPNIVFILADDLGYNDISTFGGGLAGGLVPTPNIDRLAAEGAVFTDAYSGTGTCAPSRAMLMTGRYPTRTGFEFTPTPPGFDRLIDMFSEASSEPNALPPRTGNLDVSVPSVAYEDMGLPPEEITVAEVLKQQGYQTIHIGKWHLGRADQFRPVNQGFDESLLMASSLYLEKDDPNAVNAVVDFNPVEQFAWNLGQFAAEFDRAGEPTSGERFAPGGYLTDYWTDEALNVIDANRNNPFFL
ncbi:MAG: sulfatase-like hydrolase/transferase, partial [Pseudomonadota bacterium]